VGKALSFRSLCHPEQDFMVVASISALKIVQYAAGEMRSDALSCLHDMVGRSTIVKWDRALKCQYTKGRSRHK